VIVLGVLFILLGGWRLLHAPRKARRIAERKHEGTNKYHEEQRFYAAYPFINSVRGIYTQGAIGVLAGILIVLIELLRP
jgi:hypothetical protein